MVDSSAYSSGNQEKYRLTCVNDFTLEIAGQTFFEAWRLRPIGFFRNPTAEICGDGPRSEHLIQAASQHDAEI